jgi:hypothetical protein
MLLLLGAIPISSNDQTNEDNVTILENKNIIHNSFFDVTLAATEYTINTPASGFSEISMTDYGNLLQSSQPMLPTKTFFIGLPPGCVARSIELITIKTTELPGSYQIQLAPSLSNDEKTSEEENKNIDSSVSPYPPAIYEYLGMSHMRKYSLALIRFSPMTYDLSTGTLFLHQRITLRIHYTVSEKLSDTQLSDTAFDPLAAKIIHNYENIVHYYHTSETPKQTYDYVIITTTSLVTTLTGFLNWKTTTGFTVNIVTLTWILANYPASDTQKSIRDFLIANYATWGIKYVLIVGTHTSIPMRICYPDPSNHAPDGTHDIPTDYYYADLTGNWDSDGDSFYGERGQDAMDFTPEVFVGRIPTDGSSAVLSIANKIQQFEQTAYTGWKKNAMLLGAVYQYANEDNSGNPRWDGAEVMEKCKNNLLSGFSITTMYEKQGLGPCPYTCTMGLSNANVTTQWGSTTGWGIINWAAHGQPTSADKKVWNTDNGNGYPENPGEFIWPIMIQYSDNGGLNNAKPPIVFAASCFVSRPETSNNLGISLLVSGASAFIGATRISWGSLGWTQPSHGGHGTICYDFTDRIINKNEDCGSALYHSKQYVYNTYPWNAWQDHANMYNFNLYGDPSMGMNLAPGRPVQPTGPTSGIVGISYPYSTSASDPTGDKLQYGWDWNGDGTVDQWDNNNGNYYTSGQQASITHVFSTAGTYTIQVKAQDIYGKQSTFSLPLTVLITQNQPPLKPSRPSGPSTGKPGTPYSYTTSTTDPEVYPVAYGWDWNGDGTVDQWDDNNGNYYPSGQTISTSHTWTVKGTYSIKVKAKDIHGNEGSWSDPLSVTMPLGYQSPLSHLLERFFQLFPFVFPVLRHFLGY